jgi:alkylation response protein AidB-like acyl-CoA dehydrogenase
MILALTAQQKADQASFRAFVDDYIAPNADRYEREETLPSALIQKLAQQRYLVATLPREAGGAGMDAFTYGLLTEEIGRGCASVRNLLGVSGMVAHAIMRWGSRAQKEKWLPQLGSGDLIAAFALTEPHVGSDAGHIETTATLAGNMYVLHGCKKWISFGQAAHLFLVFAHCDGKPTAFLVERHTPALAVKPISGLLGLRASMLAELHLDGCQIPRENLVGTVGAGFAWVASSALDHGRYSTACGCVGLAQACLDACHCYTQERRQFGVFLKDHQLIQRMMTNMIANVSAGRLLCYQAGYLRQSGDPDAIQATLIAKYFTSTILSQIASDAVQIHGANGCSDDYSVQRYLRDAKIMEIIEGTTQIHQLKIAEYASTGLQRDRR